jgi:hypothetical protein
MKSTLSHPSVALGAAAVAIDRHARLQVCRALYTATVSSTYFTRMVTPASHGWSYSRSCASHG